mmetsp:Transcript_56320/g.160389  ORF Transcript_56320/g.160389 Transcript_56320/m.160389 type:complete len:220 (+) Transcript_56320:1705-2364(+)
MWNLGNSCCANTSLTRLRSFTLTSAMAAGNNVSSSTWVTVRPSATSKAFVNGSLASGLSVASSNDSSQDAGLPLATQVECAPLRSTWGALACSSRKHCWAAATSSLYTRTSTTASETPPGRAWAPWTVAVHPSCSRESSGSGLSRRLTSTSHGVGRSRPTVRGSPAGVASFAAERALASRGSTAAPTRRSLLRVFFSTRLKATLLCPRQKRATYRAQQS